MTAAAVLPAAMLGARRVGTLGVRARRTAPAALAFPALWARTVFTAIIRTRFALAGRLICVRTVALAAAARAERTASGPAAAIGARRGRRGFA